MAIKEITVEKLGKAKAGWTWDRKREVYYTYQVDTIFKGGRHIRRGFVSEKEAKNYLDQLEIQEKLISIGVVQNIKFPALAELLDRHLATKAVPKARIKAERVFKDFIGLTGNIKLDELKKKHFKDYSDKRGKTVKPETVRREITEISAAIHAAGNYYGELENWQPPKIYRPQTADDSRNRIVTRGEREKLIPYLLRSQEESRERPENFLARRRSGLLLYFGFLTGLRHGELAALKKIHFDASARRLKAERTKTQKKGVAWTVFEPLNETQMDVLRQAAELYPNGEYFFSEKGIPHHKIYSILKAACARLEIPYGRFTEGGFIIHDARHTFVTTLEQSSIDSSTTRSFSGHSKEAMMKRYAHATFDSRARAMEIIEAKMGSGEAGKEAKLKNIFAAVKAEKMTFDEFKKQLEAIYF